MIGKYWGQKYILGTPNLVEDIKEVRKYTSWDLKNENELGTQRPYSYFSSFLVGQEDTLKSQRHLNMKSQWI